MNGWFIAHLAATSVMVGFIWTIQLLVYPMMSAVPANGFATYEALHQRRVVRLLALIAPAEIITAGAVAVIASSVPTWLTIGAGALLVAIWVSTGAYYAPLHGRLATGYDPLLHHRLVRANWLRTLAWTARGGAAVAMLALVT